MKKIIIFLFISSCIYGENLIIENIKKFNIGIGNNEFKTFEYDHMPLGVGAGPSLIKYDKNNETFYIVDGFNSRISIYDLKFNQVGEITYNKDLYFRTCNDLLVLENGLIFYQSEKGLIKIDSKGKVKWNIIFPNNYEDYGELENNNFYYDEENQIIFFYLKGDDIVAFSDLSLNMFDYKITQGRDNINRMLSRRGISNIIIDDNYILEVNDIIKSKSFAVKYNKQKDTERKVLIDSLDDYTYWMTEGNHLTVYDSKGKNMVRNFFAQEVRFHNKTTMPGIHPSGDLLFMTYNENNIELKRVVNTWAPEIREKWYKEHPGFP